MIFTLAFKNVVSRRSSAVIVLFIAFAVALLVVTNSVFDSTEDGVRESFSASFTGDVVVRPVYDVPLSLFGDETPFTGEFTSVPPLGDFGAVSGIVAGTEGVEGFVPQLSGRAVMDFAGRREPCFVFGVDAEEYFRFMPALRVVSGGVFARGEEALMLPRAFAEEIGAEVGAEVQFVVAAGLSSRIQSVRLAGIYEYPSESAAFSRLAVVDPGTLRELVGAPSNAPAEAPSSALPDDMDDLFGGGFGQALEGYATVEDAAPSDDAPPPESWNFVLVRTRSPSAVISRLNGAFGRGGLGCEAVGWRSAAGNTALYLYMLRLVLNAGIGIVLFAGFVVVNNTLVVGVLDRTREIGTMRAVGASRRFVSAECAAETMLLSLAAGALGLLLGSLGAAAVGGAGIPLGNAFLVQLFGSETLSTSVKAGNLALSFGVSAAIGAVAWLRPVRIALRASPVAAMQGAVR